MLFWILVAILAGVVYLLDKHYHSYWVRQGVFQKDPVFLIGALSETITLKKSLGEFATLNYKKFKNHKVLGIYFGYRPMLIVNDPELVQDVMIRDFNSFHNRGFTFSEEADPLAAHLFNVDGQRWRDLRVKMSPTFTSGKLKGMFPAIRDCVKTLEVFMIQEVKNGENVINMRDLLARYTTNVISSVAFGIENDCINEPDNIFRKMGLKIFEVDLRLGIIQAMIFISSNFIKLFKIKLTPQDVEDFFMSIVKQTIDHRESNPANERKDFMQLMIQLKNQGYLSADKDDDEHEKNSNGDVKKLTFNEVAAQAFLFFAAGFETSSSTMNFCLFELSKNPDKQKKVQEEIDKVMKNKDISDLTYEDLNGMKYLECCIDEALRIYPIVPVLIRESTHEHKFSSSDLKIDSKKILVMIPVLGMQRDPMIYDDPMEFRPERFLDSPNGNGKVPGLYYLPFGDGPRNCIGARMGKLQAKFGLVACLSKFSYDLVDKSLLHKDIEYDPRQFILAPKPDIMFKISPRF